MSDKLNKKLSDFWTKANFQAKSQEEDYGYGEDYGYDYEKPECPSDDPYDPCDTCTWKECYNDDGEWTCGDPRELLCDRVKDGICDDHPCLAHYDCDTDQQNSGAVCQALFEKFCATGEIEYDCPGVSPPCQWGNNCSNDDCFNCMIHATGNGGFGPYAAKSKRERCIIMATGGGFEDEATRDCFRRFMLSQGGAEEGCGTLGDEDCEECKGFLMNQCNCKGLGRPNCKNGPIPDCVRENPYEPCQHPPPPVNIQNPGGGNRRNWPGKVNATACNLSGGYGSGMNEYPTALLCDKVQEATEGWRKCLVDRLERCQGLQECIDNMPDATVCGDEVNESINNQNTRCLNKACSDLGQPSGPNFGGGRGFGRGPCADDNEVNCQDQYGQFIDGVPTANEYVPAPVCNECGQEEGTKCHYCNSCLRQINSDPQMSQVCLRQGTVPEDACQTGAVTVLNKAPNIPHEFVGNNEGFSDYWYEVIQSYCSQYPQEMTFLKTNGEKGLACEYYEASGIWGCMENCERARSSIKTKMGQIRHHFMSAGEILSTVFDPAMVEAEQIIPATILIQKYKSNEQKFANAWCQQNASGSYDQAQGGSIEMPKTAKTSDLISRLKKAAGKKQ